MTEKPCDNVCLWLEVSNVRTDGNGDTSRVWVQLKGDHSDKEPTWWKVEPKGKKASETANEIFSGLDKKRTVLTGITADAGQLVVSCIRIQFNDSGSR